ncbi:MAG: antibiotic biosynthesis monooxygenase [Candidatus Eisenbacteria bacterium]
MSLTWCTSTPEPPYYAVMFTSLRKSADPEGYDRMAQAMDTLAAQQAGYLGVESVRNADGMGITISYWRDEDSIIAWKRVAAHTEAQRQGRANWYEDYAVRIARVDRAYTLATSHEVGLG